MEKTVLDYAHLDEIAATDGFDAQNFGHLLRLSRLREGLSLRAVAKRIGLSAHSGVAEYESGRRLPPENLIAPYERALNLPPGYLLDLRRQALRTRANRTMAASQAVTGNPPVTIAAIEPPSMLGHQHSVAESAAIICLMAGIMLLMTRLRRQARSAVHAVADEDL
jgi:transcriptional regulator with XRE-family HTH domain